MAFGTTSDATITRDQLITLALKKVGALGDGVTTPAEMFQDTLLELGLLVHELSARGIYLHAQTVASLTLQANIFVYAIAQGLPTAMQELLAASYRDGYAEDTPIDVLDRVGYERIGNKTQTGNPAAVYLSDGLTLSSRTLTVWPMLSTVNTQSVVTGSDAQAYKCIRGHVGESANYPITGANWRLYWELGGSSPATWASGTSYEAPQLLRLTYRRPLYDFDAEGDNPDLPQAHGTMLMYLLMSRIGRGYGCSLAECNDFKQEAFEIMAGTFKRTMQKQTTTYHNKARYF
jgi:hypothetical protein